MTSIAKNPSTNRALIPVVAAVLCLVPFLGKAFNVDEPLFLWSAKQIHAEPTDFYGFTLNWYGTESHMSEVTKNPPVACYYIALASLLLGWSEIALHGAFLIPAVALALGIYYLARQFCSRPVLAALAAIFTPAFLVSGASVMCDTMMLAFWVWAVFFWLRGTKQNDWLSFLISVILITLCSLTKYFGMALLILLPIYTLMQNRKVGIWLLFLLIPVVVLGAYHWVTHIMYGRGLLLDAASYAVGQTWVGSTELFLKGLIGIAYMGGCLIAVLFFIPLLWSMRFTVAIVLASVVLLFLVIFIAQACDLPVSPPVGNKWSFHIQLGFMIAGGLSLLALAVEDFRKYKNAESGLLGLWILGTFIFAGFSTAYHP